MFRLLKPEEIDVRVAQVKQNGVALLLYKDARVDQTILDATVGAMNWKKSYDIIDGQLFCTISIWDDEKKQWVSKQDVGVESNTEAEKGRASDAQKRAAFAWGIGRELYSAPFIWIPAEGANINGNKCYDKFRVKDIRYDSLGRNITALIIENVTMGKNVYKYDTRKKEEKKDV